MKQLLVLLFLVSSMACFGQNKDALKDISSVTFYGIDFTRAKVYGAKEGPMQFKYTFDDINKLFITEPKKYDIGKRLGVNVEVSSLNSRLIMVAMLLNKADARATYQIVFFNTKTREILYSAPTNGKARGFGLRNYWAGSVHSAMKKLD